MKTECDKLNNVPGYNKKLLLSIIIFSVLNGFLCGYLLGVIAGIFPIIQKSFELSDAQISFIAGAILAGCFVSSIYTGPLNDFIGRKKTIIYTMLFYIVGIIIMIFGADYKVFYAGRLFQGIGFGMAVIVVPIYLSEVSPASHRGIVITAFQLSLTAGILISSIINLGLVSYFNWHLLFVVLTALPVILIIYTFFLPQSPRWYVKVGKLDKAKNVLYKIYDRTEAELELEAMKLSQGGTTNQKISIIFKRKYIIPILIVTAAVSLNQLTGINAFIQCSTNILKSAGISSDVIGLLGGISITGVNFVGTIMTLLLIEKIGRRRILKIGTFMVLISLIVIGLINYFAPAGAFKGYVTLIGIVLVVGFYAFGPGGVVVVLCTELLPFKVRGIGFSISFTIGALVGFFFVSEFLTLGEKIGYSGLFLLMACFVFFYFLISYAIPETKGKSLEDLENSYAKE